MKIVNAFCYACRYFVRSIHNPIVYAWVSKIHLLFDGENPNKHGQRIRDAIIRRIESESLMRYNLYLDCLRVDNFPVLDPKIIGIIERKVLSTCKLKTTDVLIKRVKTI